MSIFIKRSTVYTKTSSITILKFLTNVPRCQVSNPVSTDWLGLSFAPGTKSFKPLVFYANKKKQLSNKFRYRVWLIKRNSQYRNLFLLLLSKCCSIKVSLKGATVLQKWQWIGEHRVFAVSLAESDACYTRSHNRIDRARHNYYDTRAFVQACSINSREGRGKKRVRPRAQLREKWELCMKNPIFILIYSSFLLFRN